MINSAALEKALTMTAIALPAILFIIAVLILATVVLRSAFPASDGEKRIGRS